MDGPEAGLIHYSEKWKDQNVKPEKIETSYYSAFNVITTPRKLLVVHRTGHWQTPEQNIANQWLYEIWTTGKN